MIDKAKLKKEVAKALFEQDLDNDNLDDDNSADYVSRHYLRLAQAAIKIIARELPDVESHRDEFDEYNNTKELY